MSKTILFMRRHAEATCDGAKWEESKHKRDDGGRFSSTGGGGKASKVKASKGKEDSSAKSESKPWTKKWYSALQQEAAEHVKKQGIRVGSIVKSTTRHDRLQGRVLAVGPNDILIKITEGNYAGSKERFTVTGTAGNRKDGVYCGSISGLRNVSAKGGSGKRAGKGRK